MKKLFCAAALFPLLAFSSNSLLDVRVSVDPFDAKNRSNFNIVSQFSIPKDDCTLLISPEIALYFNKSVDFGLSTGHRWKVGGGYIGHHVFFDRSQMPSISVNQVGSGLDFISDLVDFKINYYHPISKAIFYEKRLVKPCRWLESEALFKTKFFQVGAGPTFNVDTSKFGLTGRVVMPFPTFSIGIGGMIDQMGKNELFLSTSWHLYRDKGNNKSNILYSHTKRPKLEFVTVKSHHQKKTKENEKIILKEEQQEEKQAEVLDPAKEEEKEPAQQEQEELNLPPENPPLPDSEMSLWEKVKGFFLEKS